jgi:hypothetical protein
MKNPSIVIATLATLAAAMLSSAALAQPQARPQTYTQPPPASTATQQAQPSAAASPDLVAIFDKLNTSHSGKMTKEEAQAHPTVAANFDSADTNHDGVLSKEEFVAAFKPAQ